MTIDQHTIDDLSPGIKGLVIWLNTNGFHTVDSGDGTNAADGMACAVDVPMVAISINKLWLADEADRLLFMLKRRGVDFTPQVLDCTMSLPELALPSIQASYDPLDGLAVVVLINVTSEDIGL